MATKSDRFAGSRNYGLHTEDDTECWAGVVSQKLVAFFEDSWFAMSVPNAGPLRLRSGQAFDSAEVRFAQDDSSFI
jgi:hypothetical protein